MSFLKMAPLMFLPLTGCMVAYAQESPAYYEAGYEAGTAVATDDDEVDTVVYREYFNCTDAEIALIPQYRRQYGVSHDDLYFVFFTSRRCGIPFDVCFRTFYYDCGRNYDRLVVHYRVPRESFFVAVGPGVACPPIYARPYAAYRGGYCGTTMFSNAEYAALIHMRVGCDYQGRSSAAWFARVNSGHSPRRVIVESRDDCGRGGRNWNGRPVQATGIRSWKKDYRPTPAPHQAPAARRPDHREPARAPAARTEPRPGGVQGLKKTPPPVAAPARKPEAPRHVQSPPPQRRAPAPKSDGKPAGKDHGRNDRSERK